MKSLNDVLTPDLEKTHEEAIEKMAQFVTSQAKENNDDINNGIGLRRVSAAVAFNVVSTKNESICQGYITYRTGQVLHFYAKETSRYGSNFVMGGAWHDAYVLPYDQLVNVIATYNAAGYWVGGILTLQANGREVLATPLPLAGTAAFESWGAEGKGPLRLANKAASAS